MITLFCNIASHHKSLALMQGDEILAIHQTDEQVSDKEIVALGEHLLAQAKLEYKDLERLACVIGPGGFTSLRIAVAYANTLRDQLQIPAAGIHLSDLLHVQVGQPDHIWLHATKRTAVFVRGFGKYTELWPEPVLLTLDELLDQMPEGALWCGELLEDQLDQLADKKLQEAKLQSISEVIPEFLSYQKYTPELLTPWYGREG